ncbi:MAG: LysR family transcriptional regulator [Polyangiaceae bacterium]|nr:LysR family transcriptional regulator [Polyangiaceae bacterium]
MALELNDLRYFIEVKSKGSLTGAARSLGVSQPSLSAAMQRLERHFDTTLLLRERTGVKLTVTGRALAYDAEELFEVLSRAERRVSGLEDEEAGRYVIGCYESLGAYFLPEFLRGFFDAHPKMDVSVHNASSADVREAVVERTVDFGVVVNPRPHPDLVLVDLFDDAVDFFTCAVDGASPARSLEDAFERIEKGPLVHAARVTESQSLIAKLEERGAVPRRTLACGDFELVKSILLAGVGFGLLPRRVAAYGHEGKLVRLHPELPFFADRIALVYRADMHKTKSALTLKDALVAHGKRMRSRD